MGLRPLSLIINIFTLQRGGLTSKVDPRAVAYGLILNSSMARTVNGGLNLGLHFLRPLGSPGPV